VLAALDVPVSRHTALCVLLLVNPPRRARRFGAGVTISPNRGRCPCLRETGIQECPEDSEDADRVTDTVTGATRPGCVAAGPAGRDGAAVMASRPSTAAPAVVMNAANNSGTQSTQLRAASLMASNASKLTASVSARPDTS
jgi:hypothetical protein